MIIKIYSYKLIRNYFFIIFNSYFLFNHKPIKNPPLNLKTLNLPFHSLLKFIKTHIMINIFHPFKMIRNLDIYISVMFRIPSNRNSPMQLFSIHNRQALIQIKHSLFPMRSFPIRCGTNLHLLSAMIKLYFKPIDQGMYIIIPNSSQSINSSNLNISRLYIFQIHRKQTILITNNSMWFYIIYNRLMHN